MCKTLDSSSSDAKEGEKNVILIIIYKVYEVRISCIVQYLYVQQQHTKMVQHKLLCKFTLVSKRGLTVLGSFPRMNNHEFKSKTVT